MHKILKYKSISTLTKKKVCLNKEFGTKIELGECGADIKVLYSDRKVIPI